MAVLDCLITQGGYEYNPEVSANWKPLTGCGLSRLRFRQVFRQVWHSRQAERAHQFLFQHRVSRQFKSGC